MSAADLVLVFAWLVLGMGGGWFTGKAADRKDWPAVAAGVVAMAVGIACGVAAIS